MMISKVRGQFQVFTGTVNFDPENPINTTVDIEAEINSINTNEEQRDMDLKSPDFLDATEYPVMRFKSTKVEQTDEENGKLYGDLTIKDVTRPIVLDVEFAGTAKSPWGTTNAGFSAAATINRKDWELTWNAPIETGGVLVGDKVKIEIELELIQQLEVVPA
jgi:polyisoprenoid-binding protein YceI